MSNIELFYEDNLTLMSRYPDNYFDLAIADPEYGIGASKQSKKKDYVKQKNGKVITIKNNPTYIAKDWDNNQPSEKYFDELLRVSKHQIIFGVNYFDYKFKGHGRIIWDKINDTSDQFDGEIAYCSLNNRVDIVRYMWHGMMQGLKVSGNFIEANHQIGNKKNNEKRVHPTQKPVKLYKYLLNKYAKEGWLIFDPNFGSGNIALACNEMNYDLIACENDKEYFDVGVERLQFNKLQYKLYR